MLQVIRSPKIYDVCIIGSGAAGGAAAKVLTEGGVSVVMLEAGPPLNPAKDFKEHLWPYDLPHRGASVGGKLRGEEADEFMAPNGAWEIVGEPYVSAPGSTFRWFRSRIVGGRTNHWGRVALRFSPMALNARSRDGMGDDRPISYEDLAPYYDKVESFIGFFWKQRKHSEFTERYFPTAAQAPLHRNDPQKSLRQGIRPALATGCLRVITNAMAREIVVGKDGKAEAVAYIDRNTKEEKQVYARSFVVAASTCESARLLLNSRSTLRGIMAANQIFSLS